MYGQGIGPLHSRIGRALANRVLSLTDWITVRDRLSIIALADLKVHKPDIYITAEPLLTVNQLPKAMVELYWHNYPTNKRFKLGLILENQNF